MHTLRNAGLKGPPINIPNSEGPCQFTLLPTVRERSVFVNFCQYRILSLIKQDKMFADLVSEIVSRRCFVLHFFNCLPVSTVFLCFLITLYFFPYELSLNFFVGSFFWWLLWPTFSIVFIFYWFARVLFTLRQLAFVKKCGYLPFNFVFWPEAVHTGSCPATKASQKGKFTWWHLSPSTAGLGPWTTHVRPKCQQRQDNSELKIPRTASGTVYLQVGLWRTLYLWPRPLHFK